MRIQSFRYSQDRSVTIHAQISSWYLGLSRMQRPPVSARCPQLDTEQESGHGLIVRVFQVGSTPFPSGAIASQIESGQQAVWEKFRFSLIRLAGPLKSEYQLITLLSQRCSRLYADDPRDVRCAVRSISSTVVLGWTCQTKVGLIPSSAVGHARWESAALQPGLVQDHYED